MRSVIEREDDAPVVVDFTGFDRIRARSPERINAKVAREIEEEVRACSRENKAVITRKLEDLDREWDIDRAVMMAVSTAGLIALALGLRKDRRFLRLLAVQLPFLILHAVSGWCPPAAIMRRRGFRSRSEIDAEKYALKTVRGDFQVRAA